MKTVVATDKCVNGWDIIRATDIITASSGGVGRLPSSHDYELLCEFAKSLHPQGPMVVSGSDDYTYYVCLLDDGSAFVWDTELCVYKITSEGVGSEFVPVWYVED